MGSPQGRGKHFAVGDTVADRFKIDSVEPGAIVGEMYVATDTKADGRQVAIRVLAAEALRGPNALERVKSEMRSASQLAHKNIVTTFGMGETSSGAVYLIGEHTEGQSLDRLLEERRAHGRTFSLRGAYSLAAHLCNALDFAHKTRIHGSLSPHVVRISSTGRVRIADFPISRLLYMIPSFRMAVPAAVKSYWAPEVKVSTSVISHRADIYSLGVLLYYLLTGEMPLRPDSRVTEKRPDLPVEVDDIVRRCLDPEPANRPKSAGALKEEIARLVESGATAEPEADADAGLDLEIDVERPLSVPPPPAAGAPRAAPPPPPAALPPAPPPHPVQPPPAAVEDEHRPSLGPLNLDAIMATVQDQDSEKWMITKDNLDHGPFKTREVVQMIVRWEVEGQHLIQDIETGIRAKLREHKEFLEIVERARVARVKHEEQLALEQSAKSEKRSGIAKTFVVLIVVGAVGLVVGSIFAGRAIYKAATEDEANIDDLVASGQLKIDMGQGGILDDKKRGGKRKGGGGGGGGGSYDDYMNQAVDFGDLTGDGGQVQLSQGQVNQVMSGQGKVVYPCIYSELRKNPSLKKVSLKFAIEGKTGTVKGVTITSEASDEMQSCVTAKMKKIKFPTFSAPRMGATFFFDIG